MNAFARSWGQLPRWPLLLGLLVLSAPAFGAAFRVQDPHPTGTVLVTRPTLSLPLVPAGGVRVASVAVTLNGAPAPASYAEGTHRVLCRPAQSLAPGEYAVQCHVTFDDRSSYDRAWRFTVASDATAEPPTPTPSQQALLRAVNTVRAGLGMPPLTLDASLCAAALAHSRYAAADPSDDFHAERLDRPGATGAGPQDRAAAYGFGGSVVEVGTVGTFTRDTAPIVRLFDAPYHRAPFLQPDAGVLGTGSARAADGTLATTLLFGRTEANATVVSPFASQTEVPTRWYDRESPDPLRLHASHALPVGYPIVLAHFGRPGSRLTVAAASLTTMTGQGVPVFLNAPDTDPLLSTAAFLIPQEPLSPHTTYHVTVKAVTNDDEDVSRDWAFTTGADNDNRERDPDDDPRFRPASPAPPTAETDSIQVARDGSALRVTFPKTVTRLSCYFDAAIALTKSSPAVHEENGKLIARYPIPRNARTYRLVIEEGTEKRVLTGTLAKTPETNQ